MQWVIVYQASFCFPRWLIVKIMRGVKITPIVWIIGFYAVWFSSWINSLNKLMTTLPFFRNYWREGGHQTMAHKSRPSDTVNASWPFYIFTIFGFTTNWTDWMIVKHHFTLQSLTLTRADEEGKVALNSRSSADGGTNRSPFRTAPFTKIVLAFGAERILWIWKKQTLCHKSASLAGN